MKVLHVNDVAQIGTLLVQEAKRQGLPWQLYDTARVDPSWSPKTVLVRKALRGLKWEGGLAWRVAKADLLNLHGGNIRRHTAWVPKPFVLHLHGSDVRTVRLNPAQGKIIDRAISSAEQVYYTTPDLAQCTLPLRADAQLQPIIVDVDQVPFAQNVPAQPKVLFPSRWGPEKGGQKQIDIAVALRRALGPEIIFEGLDWGSYAALAAKAAGVRLRPKMPHRDYLRWLGSGTVAVGQTTGVMGVSELDTMASGTPLVTALHPDWYDRSHPTLKNIPVRLGVADPVDWEAGIVHEVQQVLANPERDNVRDWLRKYHGPEIAVKRLRESYSRL